MAESLSVLDIDDQHCDLCVAGWTGLHHFFKALRPPIVLQPSLRIMAERVGFEPTVRFPVRSLSRRVLSTAQSPLRGCCRLNRSRALRCSAIQGRTVANALRRANLSCKMTMDGGASRKSRRALAKRGV